MSRSSMAYKELSIPAGPGGSALLEREALHIWPRGGYMLIALPNQDGSFTATLFLPLQGISSFAALSSPQAIDEFLSANFPDARALMPDCVAEFQRHPTGFLGTVYARTWAAGGAAALIGDAAHAIVPFHGQGMNCCFEDCVEFDACLEGASSWEPVPWAHVFAEVYARRKPNADAIAEMALENYLEMRERVADPHFRLQQSLALELERRFPRRFIPRYSMVMFHHEISYRTAQERGRVQAQILAELTREAESARGRRLCARGTPGRSGAPAVSRSFQRDEAVGGGVLVVRLVPLACGLAPLGAAPAVEEGIAVLDVRVHQRQVDAFGRGRTLAEDLAAADDHQRCIARGPSRGCARRLPGGLQRRHDAAVPGRESARAAQHQVQRPGNAWPMDS